MLIRDILDRKIVMVSDQATYEEAARLLRRQKVSGAPVVDMTGKVVGFISEKDLFRILYPFYRSYYENPELYIDFEGREDKASEIRNHRVATFMSKPAITVHPDMPILRAGAIMIARHIHCLPVVEDERLIGMIHRQHIFQAILAHNFERKEPTQ